MTMSALSGPGKEIIGSISDWPWSRRAADAEAPATPPAVVDKLNAAVAKIVRRPDVQAALREQGFTPASSTPEAFQRMIGADIDRYTALTEAIGLRAD